MSLTRRHWLAGLGASGLAFAPGLRGAGAATPQLTSPLPDPLTRGLLIWDATGNGYVVHEYLLKGRANVYLPVSPADAKDTSTRDYAKDYASRDYGQTLVAADQPYVIRLITFRPADPKRFSGRVVVETTHPSGGGNPGVFSRIGHHWMGEGDAYVSVPHIVTLPALKAADPTRYGELQAQDPTQLWGTLSDVGRLLRTGGPGSPLGDLPVRRIYMTGFSYTGAVTGVFASHHHNLTRMADGRPAYDGYLPMGNAAYARPLDVPVMRLNTQGDFSNYDSLKSRRPDSDVKGEQHRHYEIAGSSHGPVGWNHAKAPKRPERRLPVAAGQPVYDNDACRRNFPQTSVVNDFPLRMAQAAAFRNLTEWVEKGVSPPKAARIAVDAGKVRMDANGNAMGGVRFPQVETPIATYGVGAGRDCQLAGYADYFAAEKRKAVWGDQAKYVAAVRRQTDKLVGERLLLKDDAAELVEWARKSERF